MTRRPTATKATSSLLGSAVLAFILLSGHGGLWGWPPSALAAVTLGFVLALTPTRPLSALAAAPMVIPFIAFASLSLLWSENLRQTGLAVAAMLGEICIGLWLGLRGTREEFTRAIGGGYAAVIIVCVFAALLHPELGFSAPDGGWQGLTGSKNELGMLAAFGLAFSVTMGTVRQRWVLSVPLVIILLLSRSQTSLVAAAFAVTFVILAGWIYTKRSAGTPTRGVALIAAMGAVLTIVIALSATFLSLLGKDATLTRRTDIWHTLLVYPQDNEVFGGGLGAQIYSGSPLLAAVQFVAGPTVHTAHNGYIPLYLGLGYVGVALFAVAILSVVSLISATQREAGVNARQEVLFAIATLTVYLVTAVAEDSLLKRAALVCLTVSIGRLTYVYLGNKSRVIPRTHEGSEASHPRTRGLNR